MTEAAVGRVEWVNVDTLQAGDLLVVDVPRTDGQISCVRLTGVTVSDEDGVALLQYETGGWVRIPTSADERVQVLICD